MATGFYIASPSPRGAASSRISAPPGPRVPAGERRAALLRDPVMLIAVVVVGGIYGGIFTPTERRGGRLRRDAAGGAGARTLRWRQIRESLQATAETTAMIFVILLGAEVFNAFLALSQAPDLLAMWVSEQGFPPYGVLVAFLLAYIVLGAVMDELAMILLTLPVFFPSSRRSISA
jgi:C4-dicarboxylate transporter, DctM subunit